MLSHPITLSEMLCKEPTLPDFAEARMLCHSERAASVSTQGPWDPLANIASRTSSDWVASSKTPALRIESRKWQAALDNPWLETLRATRLQDCFQNCWRLDIFVLLVRANLCTVSRWQFRTRDASYLEISSIDQFATGSLSLVSPVASSITC